MIKIKKLAISGFRGSTTIPFELDLTNKHLSIAIFGENGTGKSTITDAIEWYYTDRVGHLWKEDCYSEALRNLNIASEENSVVEITFSNPDLNNTRILTPGLKLSSSNNTDLFSAYIQQSKKERLFFRNRDLVEFIIFTKGQKRQKIAEIIGYEEITKFREIIGKAFSDLSKDGTYRGLTSIIESTRAEFVKLVGKIIDNQEELYNKATELVKSAGVVFEISSEESYDKCIEVIQARLTSGEKVAKRQQLERFKDKLEDFKGKISNFPSYSTFIELYTKLVENKEKVKQLDLEGFLSRGEDLIEKEVVEQGKCPFCLSDVDYDSLLRDVRLRIAALGEIREEHSSAIAEKNKSDRELSFVITSYERLEQTRVNEEFFPAVFSEAKSFKDLVESIKDEITQKFDEFLVIRDRKTTLKDRGNEFSQLIDATLKVIDVPHPVSWTQVCSCRYLQQAAV